MSDTERALEGWAPVIGEEVTLEEAVDRAFDYRGDVTVRRRDGGEVVGYVCNRDREAPEPFLQMLLPSGGGPVTLAYREIAAIRFSGRDTAAGTSYAAWLRRREALRPGPAPGE